MLPFIARISTGILPVLIFLLVLHSIDSYKLLKLRTVLLSTLAGAIVALFALPVNNFVLGLTQLPLQSYSRLLAPIVEESFKAAPIIFLIYKNKTGFLVDSAIHAFAIGAGFALIENLFFLATRPDLSMAVWLVRGFGTAIMHGGVAAVFAIILKSRYDHPQKSNMLGLGLGFLLAAGMHSFYNHFIFSPAVSTIMIICGLPFVLMLVFKQSELDTREWLGTGFDTDQELLDLLESGAFTQSPVGKYLQALKSRFSGLIVADMLCMLRLHVELSIRAKGVLMLREAGLPVKPDPEIKAKLSEIEHLRQQIGKTGLLAMAPVLRNSNRELWQLELLNQR